MEGWLQSHRGEGTNDLFHRYSMTILEKEKNSEGSLDNSVNALGTTELQITMMAEIVYFVFCLFCYN